MRSRSGSSLRISLALPPTHVFEGLRALVLDQVLRGDHMLQALGLNLVYVVGAYALFRGLLESARRNGALVQMGE